MDNKYIKINDWGSAGEDTGDKPPYRFSIGKHKSLIISGAGYILLDLLVLILGV